MKITFSPPYIDNDVKAEVMAALDSGWITSGARVLELERIMSELTGTLHTACCNSATSALMLALHWFGVGKGDEVIIPAYTYAATALAVMHLGATPVMVDSGSDLNIDVPKIREKITSKTKAIIPVDIAGWPCDYQELTDLISHSDTVKHFTPATDHQRTLGRILLLADSAHAIGASYKNKPIGQWADLTVFSFHAVKNITTAEGGAIGIHLSSAFDHGTVYKTLKLWSLNGQTKDAFTKSKAGDWKYDIVYPGFKMNMPDILAAIGIAQLKKYKSFILPERKKIYDAYQRAFSGFAWAELPPVNTTQKEASCHLFALRIKGVSELQRDEIIQHISGQEVSVNVHFQPLPLLTVFRERGFRIEDYPVAYNNYAREISLPIYPGLDQEKIDFIVTSVASAYQSVMYG